MSEIQYARHTQYVLQHLSSTAGSDFISTPISVTFGNFDTEVPFSVTILNDSFIERNETFTLALSNGRTATVTIVDNDGKFTNKLSSVLRNVVFLQC